MTQVATISAPTNNPIAAVFNLDDEAERFIVGVLQRFHDDRLYRAHGLRRTVNDKGERVIVELARYMGRVPRWEVIFWNPDEISIRFARCQSRQMADAVYNTEPLLSLASLRGVKMPKPKTEKPTPSKQPGAIDPDLSMPKADFDRVVSEILKVPPERVKEAEGKAPRNTPKSGKGK